VVVGVLAHEMSHVANHDTLVATLAVTIAGTLAILCDIAWRMTLFGGSSSRRRSNDSSQGPLQIVLLVVAVLAIVIAPIAAQLLHTWAGGVVSRKVTDVGSPPPRRTIVLRPKRIEKILGIDVAADDVARLLTGLGCEVRMWGAKVDVVAPSWRPDLEREIDLVEEVARLHGYENIPAALKHGSRGGRSVAQELRERVRASFLGAGLSEATLQTFIPADDTRAIGYDGDLVTISNPMTEDQRQLRPSLFPGLLRAAQRNVARGASRVWLFEIGKIFRGWPEGAALPDESEHVGLMFAAHAAVAYAASRQKERMTRGLLMQQVIGQAQAIPAVVHAPQQR